MINPRSRSLEWITEVAQKMGVRDKALMEKMRTNYPLHVDVIRWPRPCMPEVQAQERLNGRGSILLFAFLFALSKVLIIKTLNSK